MTTHELTSRYLSDTRAAHEALDREIIGYVEHECIIEKLDNDFFYNLGMMSASESNLVERVMQNIAA